MSNMIPEFSERSISPLGADSVERKEESGDKEQLSGQGLRPNKFSFSSLFRPVTGRPQTPLSPPQSPSANQWTSRVASFVGSLFDQRKLGSSDGLEPFTLDANSTSRTITYSSSETVTISSSSPIGLDAIDNTSKHGQIQEATLPQQGYFEAGDGDRKSFVDSLMKRLEVVKLSNNPEDQLQKDIDRVSYFLDGKKVSDIESIRAFLGDAAGNILPILNQTIPNLATDLIAQRILDTAPVDTVHAELAVSNSSHGGNSIRITKIRDDQFHVEIESIGTAVAFLKKFEREGSPEFELIAFPQEEDVSQEKKSSVSAMQLIILELTKTDRDSYLMSCSSLFRKYRIQSSD